MLHYYRWFYDTGISQGSVATRLIMVRCFISAVLEIYWQVWR